MTKSKNSAQSRRANPIPNDRVVVPRISAHARERSRAPRAKQAELEFRSWGGARRGAGRKPKGTRALVPHDTRPEHKPRFPVLITSRLLPDLPCLRHPSEAARVRAALTSANLGDRSPLTHPCRDRRSAGRSAVKPDAGSSNRARQHEIVGLARGGAGRKPSSPGARCDRSIPRFQVVHYSIQSNHLHLIVEAVDRKALTSGMRGLLIRIARALNRRWERSGQVFADRFHERELLNPRQVRNALVYVFQNLRKHGICLEGPDPLSSGPQFRGWRDDARTGEIVSRRDGRDDSSRTRAEQERGSNRPAGQSVCSGGSRSLSLTRLRAARFESPRPSTWLLGVGWERHGLIGLGETPRPR
jgi:hypothetical protein